VLFLGKQSLVKERFIKKYRHPILDQKLSTKRILQEVRSMDKCRKAGVDTPSVYFVDLLSRRVFMEFIDGTTVKHLLFSGLSDSEWKKLSEKIGKALAKMHKANIVHGDLTTSNMMQRTSQNLVLIDFGLSFISHMAEDKAVDLYVLERAFISTHPKSESMFQDILQRYKETFQESENILKKLDEVRTRGRKKLAFG